METHLKVSQLDDGLVVRIPDDVAKAMKLRDGDVVAVRIEPSAPKKRKKWTEAELLEGVTPETCGPELIIGRVGRELP